MAKKSAKRNVETPRTAYCARIRVKPAEAADKKSMRMCIEACYPRLDNDQEWSSPITYDLMYEGPDGTIPMVFPDRAAAAAALRHLARQLEESSTVSADQWHETITL